MRTRRTGCTSSHETYVPPGRAVGPRPRTQPGWKHQALQCASDIADCRMAARKTRAGGSVTKLRRTQPESVIKAGGDFSGDFRGRKTGDRYVTKEHAPRDAIDAGRSSCR